MRNETVTITNLGRIELVLKLSDPDYVASRLCDLMTRSEAIALCEERNRPELVSALSRFVPTAGEA